MRSKQPTHEPEKRPPKACPKPQREMTTVNAQDPGTDEAARGRAGGLGRSGA